MKKVHHPASSRGHANHGWLQAKHSFSFANFYDPERIQFGALRVLNDDIIAPGMGFGTHPHDNMEIVTIPLEGALEHKDSMDNVGVIESDEIQVMSAGTGVYHSEYNRSKDQPVSLLQLWVFPHTQNVTPRYDQKNIKDLKIIKPVLLNNKHISTILKSKTGYSVKSISFNSINTKIGEYLMSYKNDINVIGQINENIWNNKKALQLTISDLIL